MLILGMVIGFMACGLLWALSWYLEHTPELDEDIDLNAPDQGELFEDVEDPQTAKLRKVVREEIENSKRRPYMGPG